MMDTLQAELQRHGSFSQVEWRAIEAKFTRRALRKHDYFLRAGDVCSKVGFVVNGFLRTFVTSAEGEEVTTHFSHDHSFVVSFYSFKNQTTSFECIQATEDTSLMEISHTQVKELSESVPVWRSLYNGIVEEAYACMEKRNYVLQNLSAVEKYQYVLQNEHPSIFQKASLGHIASYLGITSATLSRIRKNHI